jgi:hypothetical protein
MSSIVCVPYANTSPQIANVRNVAFPQDILIRWGKLMEALEQKVELHAHHSMYNEVARSIEKEGTHHSRAGTASLLRMQSVVSQMNQLQIPPSLTEESREVQKSLLPYTQPTTKNVLQDTWWRWCKTSISHVPSGETQVFVLDLSSEEAMGGMDAYCTMNVHGVVKIVVQLEDWNKTMQVLKDIAHAHPHPHAHPFEHALQVDLFSDSPIASIQQTTSIKSFQWICAPFVLQQLPSSQKQLDAFFLHARTLLEPGGHVLTCIYNPPHVRSEWIGNVECCWKLPKAPKAFECYPFYYKGVRQPNARWIPFSSLLKAAVAAGFCCACRAPMAQMLPFFEVQYGIDPSQYSTCDLHTLHTYEFISWRDGGGGVARPL